MTHSDDYTPSHPKGSHLRKMMLGAIGVVYGDIGTSPLYTLREAFNPEHALHLNETNILGILSLLMWSLIMVVSVKYVMFVMRADNRGEGGIMALMALASRAVEKKSMIIISLGVFGAALFYGDGIITPAISVLSAVEGLKIAVPALDPYIVPISILVLVLLFGFQQNGSDKIGKLFGPVMLFWFLALGVLGAHQIWQNPTVLWALSPYYALHFMVMNHTIGFLVLGTVVLCITGVEALYADMGHFGFRPIRMAWLYLVMPCLMLNYLGQGALLMTSPDALENPFFRMTPQILSLPMVILATLATVIASQAMISGAYTITQQAIQMGFVPRMKIQHTSAKHMGQIYMPNMNMMLFIGVILLVLWFHSSSALASAYGIAVTGTMLMTSTLAFIVAWKLWNWSLTKTIMLLTPLWLIDATFFGATLMKLAHGFGAWIPLILGCMIYITMLTWYQGKMLKNRRTTYGKEPIKHFVKHIHDRNITRVHGTAIYLTRDMEHVPVALSTNVKHYHSVHEKILLVDVRTLDIPRVPESERATITEMGHGIAKVMLYYGFMQHPNIPRALAHLPNAGPEGWHIQNATYFMTRFRVLPTPGEGMWLWREKLYAVMHRNAAEASDFFRLPPNRVIEIGSPVTI